MPAKKKPLIIIGAGAFGQIAYEYFTHDSPYEVVAFSVERPYIDATSLFGIPIVPFDELAERYPASSHTVFTALVYNRMNRVRARLYREAKALGYPFATYVSSRAFVWRNVEIGENSFIFEDNVVQPFVTIGNDVVLWSGNHIGHHSRIRDHCFLASHVVVSGFVDIGESCFIGVNATIANNVTIGPSCLVGAGAIILKDAPAATVYGSVMTPAKPRDSLTYYGIGPDE
jgi:sugar O-acyltransferase (sialic acid O-acetyltransferase NeuD family)